MACECASAIVAEMKDWVKLGGGNSGCCGNAAHTYGFHCAANAIPVTDYSRRHEAAKPYKMNWACAGDFHHGYNAKLMAMHANVLTRLMRGELPMIAEMITKPWKNKPVYYWARWNGVGTLQRYTGSGHDHWSHISWFRSRANQRAYLWTPQSGGSGGSSSAVVTDRSPGTVAPKYPGYPMKRNDSKTDPNVRIWQDQVHDKHGYTINVDGVFGARTEMIVKMVQKSNKLVQDGVVGPKTWKVVWS